MKKLKSILLTLMVFAAIQSEAKCRQDTVYYYQYVTGSQVKNITRRTINKYNLQNQILESVKQDWDLSSNNWVNTYRILNKYDNKNNLLENQTQIVTSFNNWIPYTNYIYAYNANNKIISELRQEGSTLENVTLRLFAHDNKNNLIEEVRQEYSNSNFKNIDRYLYLYDTIGNQIQELHEQWNSSNSQWQKSSLIVNKFDSNQNLIELIMKNWNVNWKVVYKISYTYNDNNNITSKLFEVFNNNNSLYENRESESYLYNNENLLIEFIVKKWITTNNSWLNDYRIKHSYDLNKNKTETLTQLWNGSNRTWQAGSKHTWEYNEENDNIAQEYYSNWNESGNYFNNHTREEYICTHTLSITEPKLSQPYNFYPNPATTTFNIETTQAGTYSILDYFGKIVLTGKLLNGTNQVDVNPIPNGMYFLQINNTIYKILIQK